MVSLLIHIDGIQELCCYITLPLIFIGREGFLGIFYQ